MYKSISVVLFLKYFAAFGTKVHVHLIMHSDIQVVIYKLTDSFSLLVCVEGSCPYPSQSSRTSSTDSVIAMWWSPSPADWSLYTDERTGRVEMKQD